MNTVLQLIRKEYRLFWADRVAVSLTFIIPLLLIMIWGAVFGNVESGSTKLHLAVLNMSPSPIARKIESALDTSRVFIVIKRFTDEQGRSMLFDSVSIQEYIRKGKASAALLLPPDTYTDTSFGLKLRIYYDPRNDIESQMMQGMLQKTIMEQIPSVFVQGMRQQALRYLGPDSGHAFNAAISNTVAKYFHIDPKDIARSMTSGFDSFATPAAGRGNGLFGNIVRIEQIQLVGQEVTNPWATRSVGGWAIMFLMFTLTGSASSLFDEKKSGVVLRILASPISRVQILWSKYLFNVSLGCIQLAVLFAGGAMLFRIDILSNLSNLIVVILASAAACTSFGMLLSAISKTSAQANGMGTFLILAMSSVGGAWFPTSLMPDFIQNISRLTIVYWAMDGFLNVLWRGSGIVDLLPNIGILLGIAAAITLVSVWQFKKGHVF